MLSPMEGVVDAVMRSLYSQIGGYSHFVTEFIRVTDQILPPHVFYKYSPELRQNSLTAEGHAVYVQLLGGRPEFVAENARVVCSLGASGIDLNFGCPAPTVNRHDGGAAILQNPHRVFDIVSSVRKYVPEAVHVTAKVRLGFRHKEFALDIARAADEAGAQMLTIHARTRDEGYLPPAHWEYIAQMREVIKRATVVANGEIWSVADYLKCREVSGCEHVALGRGAIATPDLALQIRAHIQNSSSHVIFSWGKIRDEIMPKFIKLSEEYRDAGYAVARTKQWLRQLARNYPEAAAIFEIAKRQKNTREIYETIQSK